MAVRGVAGAGREATVGRPGRSASRGGTSDAAYDIRPVTKDRWRELSDFFGPSGAYANCWCTWWRQTSGEFDAGCRAGGAGNREFMRGLVADGRVPGLLAHAGNEVVGWVSVGPREEFGRALRSPNLRPPPDEDSGPVWSVVCFWIPRQWRGRGVATALLGAAVRHAADAGAAVVEGYPVDTGGQRVSASSVFTGTLDLFSRAGSGCTGGALRADPSYAVPCGKCARQGSASNARPRPTLR